jgi:hypothetical protein
VPRGRTCSASEWLLSLSNNQGGACLQTSGWLGDNRTGVGLSCMQCTTISPPGCHFGQTPARTWRLLRAPHRKSHPRAAAARNRDRGEGERRGLRGQVVAGLQADVTYKLPLGRHREAGPVDACAAARRLQVAGHDVHLPPAVGRVAARQRGLGMGASAAARSPRVARRSVRDRREAIGCSDGHRPLPPVQL